MNDNVNWVRSQTDDVFFRFIQMCLNEMESSTDKKRNVSVNSSPINDNLDIVCPLVWLSADVRDSVTSEFYETGQYSPLQRFVEDHLLDHPDFLQEFFNSLFHYAVRVDSRVLTWNTIVVLSQIPYMYLGKWADMIAVTATRSPYMDIQEMGIRCFENWEDGDACVFLNNCSFSEKWLQDYADEVCDYIKSEGKKINVLSQKNYPWEMAERSGFAASNTERYRSGYSTSGFAY